MDKIAVVSTSINEAPYAYQRWAEQTVEPMLIVAGDLNSPPALKNYIEDLGGTYLSDEQQDDWQSSSIVGWRSIQRRNFAILEAIRWGADFIVTVDDDNAPLNEHFIQTMLNKLSGKRSTHRDACPHTNDVGYYNPGSQCAPATVARGLPYDIDRDAANKAGRCGCYCTIGVVAGLWVGDPDIDAMERMVNAPWIQSCVNDTTVRDLYAPLNSQSTGWVRDLAPLMAVLPYVGRMDDIWGGYIAQKVMYQLGYGISYGWPLVRQDRNDHDLTKDLEKEIIGYRYSGQLCRDLDLMSIEGETAIDLYSEIAHRVGTLTYIPGRTQEFMQRWVIDIRKAIADAG